MTTWEKIPEDFILPNDTVTNINHCEADALGVPALAAALTDSLEIGGRVTQSTLSRTNYGICATLNGKMVVKTGLGLLTYPLLAPLEKK